jgi:hypothetical protein
MQRRIANNSHTGYLLEGEGDTAGTNRCLKFHESHGDWVCGYLTSDTSSVVKLMIWIPIFRPWQRAAFKDNFIFICHTLVIPSNSITSIMDATSLDMAKLAVDSSPSQLSFEDSFVWEWYIRLKVTFPDHCTAADLSASINEVLKEFEDFWLGRLFSPGRFLEIC